MAGFGQAAGGTLTERNLMGFFDGTNNPQPGEQTFDQRIFVSEGPAWLRGGSYLVVRRIRMLLDEWERISVDRQSGVIGRRKVDGAPASGGTEFTPANFGARDTHGDLLIRPDAHIRLAAPAFNNGAAILRRGFHYADGLLADGSADAGLLFLAWQADPRNGFIPVQQRLAGVDALNAFIRHETSALFAVPPGVGTDGFIGQGLVVDA
jgi:dye decolorizing peroxidase